MQNKEKEIAMLKTLLKNIDNVIDKVMFSAVPFHNLNQYRVLIMNRPCNRYCSSLSVSAIPAHAGINFAKSSFPEPPLHFRPTPTRPVMVQRPIVVQRPVIVQQQQSKTTFFKYWPWSCRCCCRGCWSCWVYGWS